MTDRVKEIDYIRAISVLGVMAIHITSGYVAHNNIAYFINQLVRFAVPLFIILSGYAIYISTINKKSEGYITFVGKRLYKILIPYLIWSAIYFIYYKYVVDNLASWENLILFMKNTIKGTNAPHLYFIVIILQMYFIYPFIKRPLQGKYSKFILLTSFFITLYIQIGLYLREFGFELLPSKLLSYYYILFPTWIFYLIFGAYFARYGGKIKEKLGKGSMLLNASWFLALVLLIFDSKMTDSPGSSMKPTIILYTIVSFLFFYSIAMKIKDTKIIKILKFISDKSFLIYFSHVLVMLLLQEHFSSFLIGIKGMFLLFCATTGFTFLLVILIDKIPLSFYLGGTRRLIARRAIDNPLSIRQG